MAKAVGYRAGTAYVTVVPEFETAQKVIAKKMRDLVREGMTDEQIENEIAKRVEAGIRKGSKKGSDQAKKDVADVGDTAVDEAAKAEKKIAAERAKAAETERKRQVRDADFYKKTMQKAVKEYGKELDAIHNRFGRKTMRGRNGLAAPFHDARRAVEALNAELNKGLSGDARVLEKQYKTLTDSIERMKRVARNPGDVQSLKRMAEEVTKYRDVIEGRMTPQESKRLAQQEKEHNDRLARVEKEAQAGREAAMARRRQAERKDRMLRYQESDRARRQGIKEIEDAADASNRARVGSTSDIGEGRAGDNMRQARLIETRRKANERLNESITKTMANLSRLNSRRTTVAIVTAPAIDNLAQLEHRMLRWSMADLDKQIDVDVNERELAAEIWRIEAMLENIPDEEVDLDLDSAEAQARLNRFRDDLAALRDRVTVDLDVHGVNEARQEMLSLQEQARGIRGDIEFHVGDEEARMAIRRLEIAMDNIKDKRVGVDIRESEARAQIAEINAMLEVLDRKEIDIPIDLDVRKGMVDQIRQFNAEISRTDTYMRGLNRSIKNAAISLTETTQAFRIFSPMLTAVVFAGSPLVSLLGGVTAGLGAIASGIPGIVGGFSVLGFAFGGLSDAMKNHEDAQEAIRLGGEEMTEAQKKQVAEWREQADEIGDATVSFIEYMDDLKGQIAGVQMASREGLFPGVEAGLRTIMDQYAEPFSDFMYTMGEGFGTFARHWAELLTSPSAQEWFGRVARDADVYAGRLLLAGENFAAGLAHVVDAFRPAMRTVMNWIVDVSEGFRGWADDLTVNQTFLDFMGTVRRTMPMINDLIGNVSELFINLTVAVEPFTEAVLNATNNFLDFLNAMDPQILGAILGAIGGLAGGLMILSGVMAGVGAAAAIINAAAGSLFTSVAMALGIFVAASTTALGASAALDSEAGVLGGTALLLGDALSGVSSITGNVAELFVHLFEVIEPLVPVAGELLAETIDLASAFSGALLGAIDALLTPLEWLVEQFAKLPDWMQKGTLLAGGASVAWGKWGDNIRISAMYMGDAIGILGDYGDRMYDAKVQGKGLPGMISELGTNASGSKSKIAGLAGSFKGLAIATGIIGGISLAIMGLAAVIKENEGKAVVEGVDEMASAIRGLENSADGGKSALDEIFTVQQNSFAYWALGAEEVGGLSDAMGILGEKMTDGKENIWEFSDELGKLGVQDTQLDKVQQQMEELDDSFVQLIESGHTDEVENAFRRIADEAENNGASIETVLSQFDDLKAQYEETARVLGNVQLTEEEYYNWLQGEVPGKIETALESYDGQVDGLVGVEDANKAAEEATRDLIDATNELASAFDQSQDSAVVLEEAWLIIEEALASGEFSLDRSTEAGKRNSDALRDIRDEALKKAEADAIVAGSTDGMSDALWDNYSALVDNLEQMTGNRDEAQEYANDLYGIPDDVDTRAEFDNEYANARVDDTQGKVDDLDNSSADPSVSAPGAKGSADDVQDVHNKISNLDGESATVWVRIKEWFERLPDVRKPGSGAGNPDMPPGWTGGGTLAAAGGVLEMMAQGGLRPMGPIAQMVKPNTWRVVGDRMDVDEAYVPLDGSKRSKTILMEAMLRMPGMFMAKGGILGFANGAVASPAAGGAEGAEGDATLAPVSEAFAALEVALRTNFSLLLADMLVQAQEFFASLYGEATTFQEQMLASAVASDAAHLTELATYHQAFTEADTIWRSALTEADAAWRESQLSNTATHIGQMQSAWASYRSTEASLWSQYRANDLASMESYFGSLRSSTQATQGTLRSTWDSTFGALSSRASSYRSTEKSAFAGYYSDLESQMATFGGRAQSEWDSIWNSLVRSATSIFGELPGEVGSVLMKVGEKINKAIVDPYNKIVKDMSLDKKLNIASFPTQGLHTGGHVALRSGGFMPGYTPGRDVHTFISPTGGVLELSGGEPVLRPEAGRVLGPEWVDGVNRAARNGGVGGVQKFLGLGGGYQAHKDGGVMSFADGGTIPRTSQGIIQLGRMLQGMGVRVSEHPAFGGVGRHSPNSWHYRAGALDLNTAGGTSAKEMADFDRIMPLLYKLGWGVIWRYPNHYGHAHVDLGNRSLGSFNRNPNLTGSAWDMLKSMRVAGGGAGGGGMDFFDLKGEMKDWVADAQKSVADMGRLGGLHGGVASKIFPALADEKADDFFETAAFGGLPGGGGSGGSGVQRWRSTVIDALEFMNQPTSKTMQDIVLRRMNQESGGNPRAINNWDINARRGDPSKGLMQVIGSTFRGWSRAPYNKNIWDPMSNIVASMGWALHRYGSLPAAYNRKGGYADGTSGIDLADVLGDMGVKPLLRDTGGRLPQGLSVIQNNLPHDETVVPYSPEQISQILDGGGTQTIDNSVHFPDARFEGNPEEMYETVLRRQRVARIGRPMKIG